MLIKETLLDADTQRALESSLQLTIETNPPTTIQLMVTMSAHLVKKLYEHTLQLLREQLSTPGFSRGDVPTSYLDITHRPVIIEHLKEFFFNYCIIDILYQNIIGKHIALIGEPTLEQLSLSPENGAQYTFSVPYVDGLYKTEWKRIPFKVPGRKNYKDLDRQVMSFIQEAEHQARTLQPQITVHDWVCIRIELLNKDHQPLFDSLSTTIWLKIGEEEADTEARTLFVGKKIGESWRAPSRLIQQYLSKEITIQYEFQITIVDIVYYNAFSIEQFKHHFKLKQMREMHNKMIEIFSYRNDISQRREIIEKAFKLSLDSYRIAIPSAIMNDQVKRLLNALHCNPDYLVYKSQPTFKAQVQSLAEKQLRETAFVHAVAQHDKLLPYPQDVVSYLNLLKKQRTKEFVHFQLPPTRVNDQEQPLNHEHVRLFVLREKSLNHLIASMNKKI